MKRQAKRRARGRNQLNPAADRATAGLYAGAFTADDIIALDDRSDPDRFVIVVRALVHANHPPVSPDEDLGTASNFCGQGQRKINLGAWSQIVSHREVHTARRNIPGLATMQTGLFIDGHADVDRQR